jgi:hypothetical protein
VSSNCFVATINDACSFCGSTSPMARTLSMKTLTCLIIAPEDSFKSYSFRSCTQTSGIPVITAKFTDLGIYLSVRISYCSGGESTNYCDGCRIHNNIKNNQKLEFKIC